MKTPEQELIDSVKKALWVYNAVSAKTADMVDKYIVGPINTNEHATQVIQIFREYGVDMLDEFKEGKTLIADARRLGALLRGGYWYGTSGAGLFCAYLGDDPANSDTSVRFWCVARPATMTTPISAEEFIKLFGDNS